MLQACRSFRNTGLVPALRSLITPLPYLPASLPLRLRLRLGVGASYSSSHPPPLQNAIPGSQADPSTTNVQSVPAYAQRLQIDTEPRKSITFTCTAPGCSTRSSHTFTTHAYEKGVVLVQCPGCKVRHLIADNLHWFKDSTDEGRLRTVEDILRARGEKVRKGEMKIGEGGEGVIELVD